MTTWLGTVPRGVVAKRNPGANVRFTEVSDVPLAQFAEIIYGLPGLSVRDDVESERVVLGGCVSRDPASHVCNICGARWPQHGRFHQVVHPERVREVLALVSKGLMPFVRRVIGPVIADEWSMESADLEWLLDQTRDYFAAVGARFDSDGARRVAMQTCDIYDVVLLGVGGIDDRFVSGRPCHRRDGRHRRPAGRESECLGQARGASNCDR